MAQQILDSDSTRFGGLKALLLNCSLKGDPGDSHTMRLLRRAGGIMAAEGVEVDVIHMLDHVVPAGMAMDLTDSGAERDDWPGIHA
ncbi:MAG: hypothetical protein KDB13_15410, partial [Microthrixaceae bacterium]|nr:hypothetical protein [Microthrixaceae bacterium]